MARFPEFLLAAPEVTPLLSSDHFSVDSSLLRSLASHSWLERIVGLDEHPLPPTSGKSFGGESADKRLARSYFRDLLIPSQAHRPSTDGEEWLFKKAPSRVAFLFFIVQCVKVN